MQLATFVGEIPFRVPGDQIIESFLVRFRELRESEVFKHNVRVTTAVAGSLPELVSLSLTGSLTHVGLLPPRSRGVLPSLALARQSKSGPRVLQSEL